MPDALPLGSLPSVFSPLAKALLDGFSEGVIVFDVEGRVLYANQQAREALVGMDLSEHAPDLMPRLAALGGRLRPLRVGSLELGEAMFIPGVEGPTTLAAREKEAIVKTLDANNWKLAETAPHGGQPGLEVARRVGEVEPLHRQARGLVGIQQSALRVEHYDPLAEPIEKGLGQRGKHRRRGCGHDHGVGHESMYEGKLIGFQSATPCKCLAFNHLGLRRLGLLP